MFHRWVLYSLKMYDKICEFSLKCEKFENLDFSENYWGAKLFRLVGHFGSLVGHLAHQLTCYPRPCGNIPETPKASAQVESASRSFDLEFYLEGHDLLT